METATPDTKEGSRELGQTTAEYAMLLAGLLTVVVLFVALIKTGVLGDVVAALRTRLLELINSQ